MSDIVAFIRARLAEDEQAALAAPDGPWEPWRGQPGLGLPRGLDYAVMLPGQGAGHIAEIATRSWLAAEHIARQDPARTLRNVQADREILAMYETAQLSVEVADGTPLAGAARLKADTLRRVLVARAGRFSDHPDFDPSWSVTA